MKTIILIGMYIVLIFGVTILFGCDHPRASHFSGFSGRSSAPNEKRIAWMKEKITDRLELDEAQNEALDRFTGDLIEQHAQLHDLREEAKQTLREEFSRDTIDPERVQALIAKSRDNFDDITDFFAGWMVEFHQILTPEQRTKLITVIEDRGRCRFSRNHKGDDIESRSTSQ